MSIVDAVKQVVSPDAAAEARRSRRAGLRQEIAQITLDLQKIDDKRRQVANVEAAADRVTAEYMGQCEPWQARLTEIERIMRDAIAERQPVDSALEAERRELVRQVADAGDALEVQLEVQRRRAAAMQKEIEEMQAALGNRNVLESRLMQASEPQLIADHFAAGRAVQFAVARVQAAAPKLQSAREALAEARKSGVRVNGFGNSVDVPPNAAAVETMTTRLLHWQTESAAADKQLQAARAEEAELMQRMMQE